ncbi:MAG TPA: hypothetical protein VHL57_09225 [Flavobacteriales bacterium]|nr:hypothetical protein [Flavobacteriales bacterium]
MLILCWLTVHPFLADAQWALGVFAGLDDDVTWQTTLPRAGALVEWRPAEEALIRMRLSGFQQPTVVQPMAFAPGQPTRWERFQRGGLAFSLKWPLGCDACPRGLYRGFYVLTGAEWTRRQRTVEAAEGTAITDERTDRYGLAFGVGGEWTLRWGSPFLETRLSSAVVSDVPHTIVLFPNDLGLALGFRYCWRSRKAFVHRHI